MEKMVLLQQFLLLLAISSKLGVHKAKNGVS